MTPQSPMRLATKAFFAASPASRRSGEQVRAQADALPADEHQKQVVGQHERQHHEHEEVQVGEEAVEAAVAAHVPRREEVYEEADERDEAGVDATQAIHREAVVRAEAPDLYPRPEVAEDRACRLGRQRRPAPVGERDQEGADRRDRHRPARHRADERLAARLSPDQPADQRAHERREHDDGEQVIRHKKFVHLPAGSPAHLITEPMSRRTNLTI
jgi:hypothetical protein